MVQLPGAVLPPDGSDQSDLALSVVVGSVNSARSIGRSLESIEASCAGLAAEVIVVDASHDDTVARIGKLKSAAAVRRMPPGTLTPVLWSNGFAMSRGRVVAFTTAQCVVGARWARSLIEGIESGATGVAGSLSLSEDSDVVDWAIFYLRYSAFLGAGEMRVVAASEIPGDNAAYRRDDLLRHSASFTDGFWEVDFHRRVRAEDAQMSLRFVPDAGVGFGSSASFLTLLRHRFAHGRHSGRWRVSAGERTAWQIVAAAPLIPLLLATRIARRVLAQPSHRIRFLACLPVLLVLAGAWAAGEAIGAVSRPGVAHLRKTGLVA